MSFVSNLHLILLIIVWKIDVTVPGNALHRLFRQTISTTRSSQEPSICKKATISKDGFGCLEIRIIRIRIC
jgi:hypothetical protein